MPEGTTPFSDHAGMTSEVRVVRTGKKQVAPAMCETRNVFVFRRGGSLDGHPSHSSRMKKVVARFAASRIIASAP